MVFAIIIVAFVTTINSNIPNVLLLLFYCF